MKPTIKVSVDSVKLREEYEAGRSSLEDEVDYVNYYSYAGENSALEALIYLEVYI